MEDKMNIQELIKKYISKEEMKCLDDQMDRNLEDLKLEIWESFDLGEMSDEEAMKVMEDFFTKFDEIAKPLITLFEGWNE